MKMEPTPAPLKFLLSLGLVPLMIASSWADSLYWDITAQATTSGAALDWTSTSTNYWYTNSSGGTLQSWVNGSDAYFFSAGTPSGNYFIKLGDTNATANSIVKVSGLAQLGINGPASRTLTISSGLVRVETGTLLINAQIGGTNGLIKEGAGVLTLQNSGNNLIKAYTGATVISQGTINVIGGVLPATTDLQMQGGTLTLSGTQTQNTGNLQILSDSTINFGNITNGTTLAISGGFWSAGSLTISNWSEGVNKFLISTNGVSQDFLNAIHFTGYDAGARLVADGLQWAITPVPEPSALLLLASSGLGFLLWARRKRGNF